MKPDRLRSLSPDAIEDIARRCCGEPNLSHSTRTHLRFGSRGGLSVDRVSGAWNAFGSGGGGLFDLIVRAGMAQGRAGAAAWLQAEGYFTPSTVDNDRAALRRDQDDRNHAAQSRDRGAHCRVRIARHIWRSATPLDGTDLASRYLAKRGLPDIQIRSLRFGRTEHRPSSADLPALIAAVTPIDQPQSVCGVHRTYLKPPGLKADVDPVKAALGSIKGHGVIFGVVVDRVIIAEGIETALSAGRLFRMPAVAALGASFFATLKIPPRIRQVTIAADRGEAGERAAEQLRARLAAEGRAVRVASPPPGFGDWNDVIVAKGAPAP